MKKFRIVSDTNSGYKYWAIEHYDPKYYKDTALQDLQWHTCYIGLRFFSTLFKYIKLIYGENK